MGLDMYLTGEKMFWEDFSNPEANREEDGFRVESLHVRLGYWRKHPNLHGFIVQAFGDGIDDCQKITLDAQSIRNIISAIKGKRLPTTSGFFFGASNTSPEQRQADVAIFEQALAWLEGGDKLPKASIGKTFDDGGLVAYEIKLEDYQAVKETRSVIYQASW